MPTKLKNTQDYWPKYPTTGNLFCRYIYKSILINTLHKHVCCRIVRNSSELETTEIIKKLAKWRQMGRPLRY